MDERRQRDGLVPVALLLDEAGLARAVGEGLVLERALAALVAHGAIRGGGSARRNSSTPSWAFFTRGVVVATSMNSPFDSIPDSLTLPRFSVSIYELPVK